MAMETSASPTVTMCPSIEEEAILTAAAAPPLPAQDPLHTRNVSMLAEEENYPEPETLQEELNEIIDAFYDCVDEESIRAYQRLVEDIAGEKVAEQALMEPEMAPSFALEDQDGEPIVLQELLKKGPVVLVTYRGKWCPHCNATLMRYSKHLVPGLKPYNATLVAVSPMLPDGTAFLATKRDLGFSVCSDFNNTLAKELRITFTVKPHSRPFMLAWGEDVPKYNGVESWDIPLPAIYIIDQDGRLAWSFLDNDPGIRAEPKDIIQEVAAISKCTAPINMDHLYSGQSEHHDEVRREMFREDAQSTCSNGTSDTMTNSSNKKSKRRQGSKLFNRRISDTFKPANLRIRFAWKGGSNRNNNKDDDILSPSDEFSPSEDFFEEDLEGNPYENCGDSDHFSIRSEQRVKPKRRTPRKKFRAQSAKEFLGKYMLPS